MVTLGKFYTVVFENAKWRNRQIGWRIDIEEGISGEKALGCA